MTVYLVERDLGGITMAALGAAQQRAIAQAAEMRRGGIAVRYIRSTFVPGDGRCMCLFEAGSTGVVQDLNDAAAIPYSRVIEALDLTP